VEQTAQKAPFQRTQNLGQGNGQLDQPAVLAHDPIAGKYHLANSS